MRIPIFFRMNSAPDQMLSFGKLKLIVLLDGDEHSLVTVSNDAIMLERLQTRSVVEWPHDVMVARGQCYSVSVLVDLPERTSLISASVNFCVGRGASDSCAAAAAATNTAHGTPRRHPEMAPVTISTDAKLVTSDVGSSVLVWLKDHELTAHAQVSRPVRASSHLICPHPDRVFVSPSPPRSTVSLRNFCRRRRG